MTLLAVTGLSKKFARQLRSALWYGLCDSANALLVRTRESRLRPGEFWALDDVSFSLGRGEALAVVGGNGAGKSTLLKVLYGLLKPDRGEVRIRGEVAALIELGTGFHPQLTGRENARLGAALHGLSARRGADFLDAVIDFAELGEFIDAPVQSYSSGMRARLGYALAAQLEPALLLVDEVLAVGDLAFQRKCAVHMAKYLERGGSLLFVSHNTHQVQSLCTRGVLLDRGRAVFSGSAVDAMNRMFELRLSETASAAAAPDAGEPFVVESLTAAPLHGDEIRTGEAVRITLACRIDHSAEVVWGFSIWTSDQWVCVAGEYDPAPHLLAPGRHTLTCVLPHFPLVGGRYVLRAAVLDATTRQPIVLPGWGSPGGVLDVRSTSDATANSRMANHQLVVLDVKWTE